MQDMRALCLYKALAHTICHNRARVCLFKFSLKMGASSSKVEDIESFPDIQQQVAEMQTEVTKISPVITTDVIETVNTKEDALVMKYSNLQDLTKIKQDVEKIFSNNPAK